MIMDIDREHKLHNLCESLAYFFHDLTLLDKALTHRSYVNENKNRELKDNERFEFLGDSVLDLVVARYTVISVSELAEGELSKIRAQVVNEQSLAQIAEELQIGSFLLLGKGEDSSGGRNKNSILADAFEAIVAAVYLDSSFENSYEVFIPMFKERIATAMKTRQIGGDFKGELQAKASAGGHGEVSYRLTREEGPDHDKLFTTSVFLGDEPVGVGVGRTKKEAEQLAAKSAIEKMFSAESQVK